MISIAVLIIDAILFFRGAFQITFRFQGPFDLIAHQRAPHRFDEKTALSKS